jgi:4-amino-4-deoxy-L-arabinose transferase-like glycosyltransferase
MQDIIKILNKHSWILYLLLGVLLFPALLINLGLHPFISDEAVRALVSMEMIFSGDYITPTLAGDLYYRKPPCYNWLISIFYLVSGNYSDLTLRLVAVFSLIAYAAIIFLTLRRKLGQRNAFLVSFMFITCGRILFYDSFHGLIDIGYSALVFLNFMLIWHFIRKKKYLWLFLVSYGLTGITCLMKGLPSFYYQGITLIVAFLLERKFRLLFTLRHLAGIFLLAAIVVSYYWAYATRNPGELENMMRMLLFEATQKTALGSVIWRTVTHFFTFPFEFIYHFLPWTLLAVYFIRRDIKSLIFRDPFIRYCLYLFFFNILVFWFSPDTFARYLFIHATLLFPIMVYLHDIHMEETTWQYKMVRYGFLGLAVLAVVSPVFYLFFEITRELEGSYLKVGMLLISSAVLLFLLIKLKESRVIIMFALLLVARIGFNWFIIPSREKTNDTTICRDEAITAGRGTRGTTLKLYRRTPMVTHFQYYITRERMQPLEWTYDLTDTSSYYVIYEPGFEGPEYVKYYDVKLNKRNISLSVVKFLPE